MDAPQKFETMKSKCSLMSRTHVCGMLIVNGNVLHSPHNPDGSYNLLKKTQMRFKVAFEVHASPSTYTVAALKTMFSVN